MKTIAFKTLGCRLNQFETESIASNFDEAGYKVVPFNHPADIYVVNTCTVTNQGDSKSRYAIKQAHKKNGKALLLVTGCMANSRKEQLENEGYIHYVIENEQKSSILPVVDAHFKGELVDRAIQSPDVFSYEATKSLYHTRTMVKIQDGCDNFCTFCIIPFVRGRAVSRPAKEIIDNVKRNIDRGYKEITLTGVNISRYQHDEVSFNKLIGQILEIDADFRLRLSSMEPDQLDDQFVDLFSHPRMAQHLHLCLQSGSEPVLLRMRRMYTAKEYLSMVEKIRKKHPDFNFTTDILVGFPGETETDFKASCQVARDVRFSHIHTFKYSKRDNTRAARMENQVPELVKDERSRLIREISRKNRENFMQQFIGKKQRVLTEKPKESNFAAGYGQHYLPVNIPVTDQTANRFLDVEIAAYSGEKGALEGKLLT